jgi:signal transduction histidine kinase
VERAESLAPHLSIVISVEEPPLLNVDAEAVREILGNLLENARRHAVGRIDASVVQGDDTVSVYVCDDGPGLADGVEAEAFEPFVSLDGKGGSGLGLSLSKALARAHGGDLTYEDRSFVVRLPVCER